MNKTNSEFDYKSALCAQTDPELFFPDNWMATNQIQQAKAICANCPVIQGCLAEAIRMEYNDGIWGGKTPRERYAMVGGTSIRWQAGRKSLRPRGERRVIQITKETK